MTNLSIGGDTFRVEVEGDPTKPALLLSHSLGADLSLWDAQMPALLKAFRVIRYDSRGHGDSTANAGAYSIAMLGRDVLGILDALEIETTHFVGISMGGAVGQWLLAMAPHRIGRAVLANTTAKFGTPAKWNERIVAVLRDGMASVADGTIERWFRPEFAARAPETVAAVRAVLETVSPQGYAACCAALRDLDLRAALHGITAPVLVLSGRDDKSMGEEATRLLVDTIPGAKHVALDTRHISNVEADVAFSKAVVGFLTAKIPTKARTTAKAESPVASGARGASARPASTVNRRVGTRRSTAARLPLTGLAKAPMPKATAPKTRVIAPVEPTLKKTGTAKTSNVEAAPPKTMGAKKAPAQKTSTKVTSAKTAPSKAPSRKTAPAKNVSTRTTPAKATAVKTPSQAAKPALAKRAKTSSAPASTRKTNPASLKKIAKRPSAKSLKAMAASPAPKARVSAKAAPGKAATPTRSSSTRTARGAKSKIPVAVAPKSRVVSAAVKPKTTAAKAVKAVRTAPTTKAPGGKSAKAASVAPSKTTLGATKTKARQAEAAPKAAPKAKPGRRAS